MKEDVRVIQSVQRAIDILNCVADAEKKISLREISEKKYMFVEKKYRKYDKANELFREEDS